MSVFDIIGPIMIGPSSSHTAGAAKIGKIARDFLGSQPVSADIGFSGSFARTYKGHGTDKAIVGGIMGMMPDDVRIRNSIALAKEQGISINIREVDIENAHPNTAVVTLTDKNGKSATIEGASVGGGNILIKKLNNTVVSLNGHYTVIVIEHKDKPGTIAAVTNALAPIGINICNFNLSREQKGGNAVMTIEIDGKVNKDIVHQLKLLPNVIDCTIIQQENI